MDDDGVPRRPSEPSTVSYLTSARERSLAAHRMPAADSRDHTGPAEDAGPARVCTATIRWIDALQALARLPADGGAPDDGTVVDPAALTCRSPSPSAWLPMLSRRERQVLGYAPSMLSTAEIGGRLFVSVNAVKAQLKSIYRKLGVTRRGDAVAEA